MKKVRMIGLLFLFGILANLFILKVSAAKLTKGDALYVYNNMYHIYNKTIGTSPAYCIDGIDITVADTNSDCTSKGTDAGIGYIIHNGGSYTQIETNTIKYHSSLSTLWTGNTGDLTANISATDTDLVKNKNIASSSFTVTLDSSSLTFRKNGNYYVSDPVKGDGLYYVSGAATITPSGATGVVIEGDYSNFVVKVPVENVTSNATISVNISATQQKYYDAEIYECGASNKQRLAIAVDRSQRTSSKSISGTIQPTKLTIKKVDGKNKKLAGVKIKVTGPNNYSKEFTTTNSDIVIYGLDEGTYNITELETLPGYNLLSTITNVTISSTNLTPIATLKNTLTETYVSKKSAVDGGELPGATLEILNKNKKSMGCTILDEDGNEKHLDDKCSWISGKEPTIVVGLPADTYFLKETIAPKGYELNENMVDFKVKADGSVTEVEMVDELEVEVPNTLSAKSALLLTVAMIDIALGIGIITYVKKNKLKQ